MSGIVGIQHADGAPVDSELLRELTAALAFRGPARQEVWLGDGVGLGHADLSFEGRPEGEAQPISLDGQLCISADVRLDGRRELMGKLRARDRNNLESCSDAELILHSYQFWGDDCLHHLLGDFAFALWDQARQRLLCAVDHFRVKLLYYAQVGHSLVFGNSLDCLRQYPGISGRLNETAVGDFLLFQRNQDTDITIYADIKRLPPAHYLVWEDGRVRRGRYWSVSSAAANCLRKPSDCLERFDELLTQAVGDRLNGSHKTGILMSGGLDSPLLAAKAGSLLPGANGRRALKAFTVVFDHLIPDRERHYAGLVAQALDMPIEFHSGDDIELDDEDEPDSWQPPEPVNEPCWGWSMRYLRQIGSTHPVILTGFDGDSLLQASVPRHFQDLLKSGRLGQLARDLAWYLASQRRLPPIGLRSALRGRQGRQRSHPPLPGWLSPDFVRRAALAERWAEYHRPRARTTSRGVAQATLTSPYWAAVFDRYDASWTGSPTEFRHPLMDVRLVSFLAGLPAVPWCVHKELFRRHLAPLVPRAVCRRPKTVMADDAVRLKLERQAVPWHEGFSFEPELASFVDEAALPRYSRHLTVDDLYLCLRPYCLNLWLKRRQRKRELCPILANVH
jgi:asparagine synthase (glutamine-hydrolysing)